jgi:hypothetical protein
MKASKTEGTLTIVFSSITAVLFIIAILTAVNSFHFLDKAISVKGRVVDLDTHYSSNSSSSSNSKKSNSPTYAPVVAFVTVDGEKIVFTSSTSSNPPSYRIGESIEVLYLKESPRNARIDGFFSLWGLSLIVGIIGLGFGIASFVMIYFSVKKKRLKCFLDRNGKRIQAKYIGVYLNTLVSVNGNNPYVIEAEWQNPATKKTHNFKSENLWFNPEEYIKTDVISVLIDLKNPKNYWLDTSFLPLNE